MIVPAEEYYQNLIQINDTNKPILANLLPSDEKIYNIDLNTRKVEVPQYLSVKKDHRAETVYFTVDRYYDNMDLSSTVCLIQYINDGVKKETGIEDLGHFYLVPFYDITTFKEEKKILFPWQIGGPATAAAGTVNFSFRFFILNAENQYLYSLNTLEATSKVLYGMDITDKENENLIIPADTVTEIYNKINELSSNWLEI